VYGAVLNEGEVKDVLNLDLGVGLRSFIGIGDRRAKDVDLFLLNNNRQVIQEDTRTNPEAVIANYQARGGRHGLRLRNYQSNGASLCMMAVFDVRDFFPDR